MAMTKEQLHDLFLYHKSSDLVEKAIEQGFLTNEEIEEAQENGSIRLSFFGSKPWTKCERSLQSRQAKTMPRTALDTPKSWKALFSTASGKRGGEIQK